MGEVITSVPSPRRVAGKVSEGALFCLAPKMIKLPRFMERVGCQVVA